MNALVPTPQYHAQLPAFLRSPDLFAATDKTLAGIGGGTPPSISIRASRFHLVGNDGVELLVNQLNLDVIVLSGNEHLSKIYYAGAYDPAAGNSAPPTCFSDNGSAPSTQAAQPQAPLCAGCPHNAWGSKVTPAGAKVKECGDYKKLAVVLAVDTPIVSATNAAGIAKAFDQVYLLRIPGGSLSTWRDYAKDIHGRGIPIIGIVTRLSFDSQKSHPALLFGPVQFIDEAGYKRVENLPASQEVLNIVGALDTPRSGPAAAPPIAPPPAAPAPLAPPLALVPPLVAPAPVASTPAAEPVQRRRGRPPATAPVAPAPVATAPAPLFPPPIAGNGAVIQTPQASSSELDALLAQHLGTPA